MITLFHGSNTKGIKILEPRVADHDKAYIYLTVNEVVAAFYLCNAVERPFYWFPYGFAKDGKTPIYHELYENALQEVSDGVTGCIYQVLAEEKQVLPFKNIPCARLGIEPLHIIDCIEVHNAYKLFQKYIKQGKMFVGTYKEKSEKEMTIWYEMIFDYLKEKEMITMPECSYAKFVKDKFPSIWKKYENSCD